MKKPRARKSRATVPLNKEKEKRKRKKMEKEKERKEDAPNRGGWMGGESCQKQIKTCLSNFCNYQNGP